MLLFRPHFFLFLSVRCADTSQACLIENGGQLLKYKVKGKVSGGGTQALDTYVYDCKLHTRPSLLFQQSICELNCVFVFFRARLSLTVVMETVLPSGPNGTLPAVAGKAGYWTKQEPTKSGNTGS
eukprot:sb/3475616/